MPPPFKRLTLAEFGLLLERFPFTRRIAAVHMHHTWRPNHAQFRGHESLASMWRFHTQERHFSDIAQHLTIAPDGGLWTGRDWNAGPASASGYNGNAVSGPFMFEVVGDFDRGMDVLAGPQRAATLDVIKRLLTRFGLTPETLMFHNQMAAKSCPGTAIVRSDFLQEVRQHTPAAVARASRSAASGPLGDEAQAGKATVARAIARLTAKRGVRAADPPEAELDYGDESPRRSRESSARAGSRSSRVRAVPGSGRSVATAASTSDVRRSRRRASKAGGSRPRQPIARSTQSEEEICPSSLPPSAVRSSKTRSSPPRRAGRAR